MSFRFIFSITFLLFSIILSAQNTAEQKARIAYNLAKEIEWENENDFYVYDIIVWEDKDTVYNTFLNFTKSGELLKGKRVNVFKVRDLTELNQEVNHNKIQMFYLSGKNLKYADSITSIFEEQNTLIIFDNAENTDNCVINLLNDEDKYYEINYQNAIKHHLKLTENIMVLGGNEDLLREMYLDSMRVLRQERQNILLKLYQIEDQETRLDLRQKELEHNRAILDSINVVLLEKNKEIKRQSKILKENLQYITAQKRQIKQLKKTYQTQLQKIDKIEKRLSAKVAELREKEKKLKNLDQEFVKSLKKIKTQADYIKLAAVLFILAMSIIIILYIRNKEAQKIKEQNIIILNKNEEIMQINAELENQQQIISEQNRLLSYQINEITSSINYARRIQLSLFPIKDVLSTYYKQNFILYLPKDIVSGDFYWFRKVGDKIIIAVADCTGHGVPGAFMSVLGMTFLSEITNSYCEKANIILELLREKVILSLEHDDEDDMLVKDGMDIALAIIDPNNNKISFSGAYNSLVKVSRTNKNVVLNEVKGDLMPVGQYFTPEKMEPFTEKIIDFEKGDRIYMFSDGYKDQFGGEKGRKLTKKRFYDLIKSVQDKNMSEQHNELKNFFENWLRGSKVGQIDDVLVLGIEL